jgi:hypothetical protein
MAKNQKFNLASPPFLVPVLSIAAVVLLVRPLLGRIRERGGNRPAAWVQAVVVVAGVLAALGRFLEASYAELTDEGVHLRLFPPLIDAVIPYSDVESVVRVAPPGPFSVRLAGADTLGVSFSGGDVAQINLRGVENLRILGFLPLNVRQVVLGLTDPDGFVAAFQQRRQRDLR